MIREIKDILDAVGLQLGMRFEDSQKVRQRIPNHQYESSSLIVDLERSQPVFSIMPLSCAKG
jgi:hypothetical protein